MNVWIASDSFKDALPAEEVCRALAEGWSSGAPGHRVRQFPLADGGEGTARLLTRYLGGEWCDMEAEDPLGRPVHAFFGLSMDRRTAYLDMASASGLEHLAPDERDPLRTSTRGTGQLIRHLSELGVETLYLGLGGSATHDLGTGMAEALGFSFRNRKGDRLLPCGKNLVHIRSIDRPDRPVSFREVILLSDVQNPLTGANGAAHTFARQKGANEPAVDLLERGSRHMADRLLHEMGLDLADLPGGGAAGGFEAGAVAFLGGRIESGAQLMLERSGLLDQLPEADLVLTGEGRLDASSLSGKLLSALLRQARQNHIPLIAFCGSFDLPGGENFPPGLTSAFSITDRPMSLEESLERTAELLRQTAFSVARALYAS